MRFHFLQKLYLVTSSASILKHATFGEYLINTTTLRIKQKTLQCTCFKSKISEALKSRNFSQIYTNHTQKQIPLDIYVYIMHIVNIYYIR